MTASQDASGYIYENVGLALTPSPAVEGYIYENVGLALTPSPAVEGYIYENVVYGKGKVQYPWKEADDGSTSPTARY